MPFERARAHYEIGRHLPPGDPNKDHHLDRAYRLFEELKAMDESLRLKGEWEPL
jgi:hypothetical protein